MVLCGCPLCVGVTHTLLPGVAATRGAHRRREGSATLKEIIFPRESSVDSSAFPC